jgi:geranylgeranyl diphosphate synthase type I
MQDLYLEAKNTEPSRQTLYDLMEAKTAAYTIALPLAMGAVLAGDAPETIKKLRTFGVNTGLIFQIRDDELGVMGDSNRTGKPIDSDIREGKKTLLRYYLFEQCDAAERARLKTIFGNSRASAADIAYVRELVKSKGVSRLLEADVANLESKARETLKTLQLPAAAHKELEWLVAFCAQRTV